MDAERRRTIERLTAAALTRSDGERPAFLEGACGGDRELRHEVESLLGAELHPVNFCW